MKRKVISILLCASLCLSMLAFTGCSAENKAAETSDSSSSDVESVAENEELDSTSDATLNAGDAQEVVSDSASEDVESASENEEFDGIFDATLNAGNAQEVVYVNGSWFDMGRQYGLQQKVQLENNWASVMAFIYAEADDAAYNEAMGKILKHYEEDEPSVFDFLSGVADGAGISKEDAVVAVMGSSVLNYDLMMNYDPERSKTCMTVSTWGNMTQDGHHLGGANLDALSATPAAMFSDMISYPDDGYAVIVSGGLQGNAFMNSEGLIITYAGGPHASPDENDEVLDREGSFLDTLFAYWYTATKCASADEAVAMLTEGEWIHTGNINVSDNNGNAYVIEQKDYAYVVRKAGDHDETDYLITANHFMDESWMNDSYDAYPDSVPRANTLERIMLDENGNVTPLTLANGLGSIRYYDEGKWSEENWDFGGFYQFHSPEGDDLEFKTIFRTIFDATDLEMYVMRGHDEKFRSDVPYGTANYYRLVLGEGMQATNRCAEIDARTAVRNAGAELYKNDSVDDSSLEYYNMAAEAVHTGCNYTIMADCVGAKGDTEQAAILYGLATSQFANAQRYAQAAYTTENVILN